LGHFVKKLPVHKHVAAWGKLVEKGSLIVTAVQCNQGDACDYKFSDGASNKRGSVE